MTAGTWTSDGRPAEAGSDPRRAPTQSVGTSDGGAVVAAPEPSTLPERVGPYRVVGLLGRGGMGVVYEAEHEVLGRRVALKTLAPGRDGRRRTARFLAEARTAATLRHASIVPVVDAGAGADGKAFLVMELIDGPSLEERLRRDGPLSPVEAVGLLLPIARALGHAHAQQVVHRDVKPGNVLVDRDGRAFLADFGLACDLLASDETSPSRRPMGTLGYTAPEQVRGEAVGPAADVYAFGATLFEALTGRPPHVASTFGELLDMVATTPAPRARLLNRAVDRDLDAIVRRCLARRPGDRFADGAAVARALEAWAASRSESDRRRPRRRSGWLGFAAGIGLAVGAGLLAGRDRAPMTPAGAVRLARADVEREAALAVSTAGRVAAWDRHLDVWPADAEARLARAQLLRQLSRERRSRGDGVGAHAAARAALEDLQEARAGLAGAGVPDEHGPAEAALLARVLLAEAETARVDLGDPRAADAAYAALEVGEGALADYARARRLHARGDDGRALELARRALAARPELEPARALAAALAPARPTRVPGVSVPTRG